jgi:hypothetical protein
MRDARELVSRQAEPLGIARGDDQVPAAGGQATRERQPQAA